MTGQTFGKLTAIRMTGRTNTGQAVWLFRCACGGEKEAKGAEVRRGNTSSCGCVGRQQRQQAAQSQCHPYSRANMPALRKVWENMHARCSDPEHRSFPVYGGRGIRVCDRWADFPAFADDMGDKPTGGTLDRIDPDGPYTPENCRWASHVAQANNRRNNVRITADGRTQTVAQWVRETGVPRHTIMKRLKQGVTGSHLFVP